MPRYEKAQSTVDHNASIVRAMTMRVCLIAINVLREASPRSSGLFRHAVQA